MMKNRIKNAVVKLGIIDGWLGPLFVPYFPSGPNTAIGQNHAVSRGFFLRSLCALLFKIIGCGLPRCDLFHETATADTIAPAKRFIRSAQPFTNQSLLSFMTPTEHK